MSEVLAAQKNVIVVLGMSRSGTSAIARSLTALGVDIGEKFRPGNELNPTGFYEDLDILHNVNRGVSAAIHFSYMYVDTVDDACIENNKTLKDFQTSAIKILTERLRSVPSWGFKDPRTTTVLPFWKSVFKKLNVDDKYVIVVRNPLAAAYSNQKFANCDIEEGMIIWLKQLFAAVDGTHGKKRVVVAYESMLQNPEAELERMRSALKINSQPDPLQIAIYVKEFLDNKLRHYNFGDVDLHAHPASAIVPLCLQLYEVLKLLAKDEIQFTDERFSQLWQGIKSEYKKILPVYDYLDGLQKQRKQLEKSLDEIKGSLLWRIFYPFHALRESLRARRRMRKEQKRLWLEASL